MHCPDWAVITNLTAAKPSTGGVTWPFYTPELELGVGVALVGMYQADSDPDSKISTLSLSGFASSTRAFGLNLNNYTYLDNDNWRFYLSGTINNVPTDYWGKAIRPGVSKIISVNISHSNCG